MKKRNKILSRAAAVIAVLALLIVPASVFAAVGDVPSLFHNDEEWYKDGLYPLAVRNGEYYIPAELFSMFEDPDILLDDLEQSTGKTLDLYEMKNVKQRTDF